MSQANCLPEESVKYPTFDEFLARERPNNAYIDEPGFAELYLRKGVIGVQVDGQFWRCVNTITIARVAAQSPDNGTFTRFVEKLKERGFAVFVENAHERRFQEGLLRLGFEQVNNGPMFLVNYEGHLQPW